MLRMNYMMDYSYVNCIKISQSNSQTAQKNSVLKVPWPDLKTALSGYHEKRLGYNALVHELENGVLLYCNL